MCATNAGVTPQFPYRAINTFNTAASPLNSHLGKSSATSDVRGTVNVVRTQTRSFVHYVCLVGPRAVCARRRERRIQSDSVCHGDQHGFGRGFRSRAAVRVDAHDLRVDAPAAPASCVWQGAGRCTRGEHARRVVPRQARGVVLGGSDLALGD